MNKVKKETDGIVKVGDSVPGWGYRHQQCLVLFICLTLSYSVRSSMGVALLAMTDGYDVKPMQYNQSVENDMKTNNSVEANPIDKLKICNDDDSNSKGFMNSILLSPPYPKFEWTKKTQDAIQTSFFWGYTLLQIPAGFMADRFGPRRVLAASMAVNCFVSVLLPLATYHGGAVVAASFRAVQGLSQAFVVPAMHSFFGHWSPVEERGRLTSYAYGGLCLGTVLGLLTTGFLAASPMGWPSIFYFNGVSTGIIAAVMWYIMTDTPAEHPRISIAERRYIEEGLGLKDKDKMKRLRVPWLSILRSPVMFAIAVAHLSQTSCHVLLYTQIPAYMDKVMGLNIKTNGLLTAFPFVVMWFGYFFFSWLTDMIIVKKVFSVTNTRKLATSLGFVLTSIGLVSLGYVPKDIYVVETILIMICFFKVSANLGFYVNHIDVAPNFAGPMMSISNFIANLFASQVPLVTSFVVSDATSQHQWRMVFYLTAGFYLMATLIYVVLASSEKADWNDPQHKIYKLNEKEADPMLQT